MTIFRYSDPDPSESRNPAQIEACLRPVTAGQCVASGGGSGSTINGGLTRPLADGPRTPRTGSEEKRRNPAGRPNPSLETPSNLSKVWGVAHYFSPRKHEERNPRYPPNIVAKGGSVRLNGFGTNPIGGSSRRCVSLPRARHGLPAVRTDHEPVSNQAGSQAACCRACQTSAYLVFIR